MKKRNLTPVYITSAAVFIILYIILAAHPLGKEYCFSPDWKINVNANETNAPISDALDSIPLDEELLHFKLGQTIGYFTKDGEVALCKSFPSKASISDSYFSIYNSEAQNIQFYNSRGNQAGTISASGFPFFDDDRIYIFLPGGGSFAYCNHTGSVEWTCESTIPITAFSSNSNYVAAGYADGSIKVLDNHSGQIQISFAPGGSDNPVLLGLDISPNGEYVASISGLNKQRFVLAHKEENQPKILFHTFLSSDLNRRTFVKFSSDGQKVFYNYENHLGIYDLQKQKNYSIWIDTKILSMEETDDLFFLLGKKDNSYTVYIIERTNVLEGYFSFEADSAFIKTYDNYLFTGKDETISRITILKE